MHEPFMSNCMKHSVC